MDTRAGAAKVKPIYLIKRRTIYLADRRDSKHPVDDLRAKLHFLECSILPGNY